MAQYYSSVLRYLIQQPANLALQVPTQDSKFAIGIVISDIQNKLGNQALKSDVKSTISMHILKNSK